jgi:hypothetical protein
MQRYNISPDGQRVVFTAVDENGHTPVWLAFLNGQTQPRKLTAMDCWDFAPGTLQPLREDTRAKKPRSQSADRIAPHR